MLLKCISAIKIKLVSEYIIKIIKII